MSKIINWVKSHKLATFLLLVIAYFLSQSFGFRGNFEPLGSAIPSYQENSIDYFDSIGPLNSAKRISGTSKPATESVQERMVITNSSMSLHVKNVSETRSTIESEVKRLGGFIVSEYIQKPEEAASGRITARVPSEKLSEFLDFLRNNSVKVVSENIEGQDITDQYSDIQAKLDILNRNKVRYMEIMEKAEQVTEIMQVQQQIFSLQDQIDGLKGQLMMMEKSANMTLISINISTDELSLPYAPDNAWRPQAIYKQAVRSVVGTLRGLGSVAIWVAVYAAIWIPALLLFKLGRYIWKKRHNLTPTAIK